MRRALPCPRRSTLLDKIRKPLEGFPDCRLPRVFKRRAWGEGRHTSLLSSSSPPDAAASSLSPPTTTSQGSRHRRRRPPFQVRPLSQSPPPSSPPFSPSLSARWDAGRRCTAPAAPSHLPPCPSEIRQGAYRAPVVPFPLLGCAGVPAGANGPCGPPSLPRGRSGRPTGGRSSPCHPPLLPSGRGHRPLPLFF